MRCLVNVLFLVGSVHMAYSSLFDVAAMYKSVTTTVSLAIENGFSGYNPNLTAHQVLNIYCAKPSEKVFKVVYLDDTEMATKLDLTKPVGFVTHGWVDNGNSKWMRELAQAWIENHDTNVCRVDWSIYALVEYSVAARRNVKLVGQHLANFIKMLRDVHGVAYGDVTLIGHSLGGQVAGIVGHLCNGGIGRIIGMDPAGPLFTFPKKVALENQLDKSDAKFVSVIHTNDYICGVGYSIGHADFYPSAGLPIQPGCIFPFLFGIYDIDFEAIVCSHFRAIRFVHLAMYKNPQCIALKCDSYADYLTRHCTNTTDTWGVDSAKINGDFYFWGGINPKCSSKFWAIQKKN